MLVSLFATLAVAAVEPRREDAYQSIIDRNPFGLKDLPAPRDPALDKKPEPEKPKSEFYLTGISTMGYPKRPKKAYLINKDQSKKDYSEKYFNMAIGDRAGDLALQDIDEKNRRVKIAYRGEEMWLNMKDNGVPALTGPAPGMPGGVGMVGQPMPLGQPGGVPALQPNPNSPTPQAPNAYPNTGNRRIPRSTLTSPGTANAALTPAPAPAPGPQTDAEVLEQIIRMQNPGKFNQPGTPPGATPSPGRVPPAQSPDAPPMPPLPF